MRESLPSDPFGLLAVVSFSSLCLLVAAAGGVAIWAETTSTWRSFFLMERTMAMAVPATKGLVATSVAAGVGLVVRTS